MAVHIQVGLNLPSLWVERENGLFYLKRFTIPKGAHIVVIEDIVTTGLSVLETIEALKKVQAKIVGVGCLIDRSEKKPDLDVPLISLCQYKIPTYAEDNLPLKLRDIPAVKPGSRIFL